MMKLTIGMIEESGILHAALDGVFTLEEARSTFLEILDAASQRRAESVLVDGRGITGTPTTMQRFFYGEFVAGAVQSQAGRDLSRAPRFAYVLREPVLDPGRFGEDVAVNRGMKVKTFDTFEGALKWLMTEPPS
jgi:hypothetical protein